MPTMFLDGACKNMMMLKLKNTKTKDFQVDSPCSVCHLMKKPSQSFICLSLQVKCAYPFVVIVFLEGRSIIHITCLMSKNTKGE
jgi:hypothetical protein